MVGTTANTGMQARDKPGVRVTTSDGLTVEISGSPYFPDVTLRRMFDDAYREVQRMRKENGLAKKERA